MSPQPAGPASGEIGCLLLPIKAHKLCPQIPLNGISVLGECVCACVSERSEEAGLRRKRGRGLANRETVLVTGPKGLDAFLQLLHQFRQESRPSGERIRKKPCLDTRPNRKRCLRASQPKGAEITHDKAFALCWVEAGASAAVERLARGLGEG